jgi:rhodanese-related sulfurtransferase
MAYLLLLRAPFTDRVIAFYKGHEAWIGITVTLVALLLLGLYGLKRLPHVVRAKKHPTLTPLQLEELLQGPPPLLVDLRDPAAFKKEGHIKGVLHIPFPQLEKRIQEVLKQAKGKPARAIVLIDEHDPQAHAAADILRAYDVDWLYVLMDGFHGWRKGHFPVVK